MTNVHEIYDQSFNPINQITVGDVTEFEAKETEHAQEIAVENGLLDKAKIRMEEVVQNQVKMMLGNTAQESYAIELIWQ